MRLEWTLPLRQRELVNEMWISLDQKSCVHPPSKASCRPESGPQLGFEGEFKPHPPGEPDLSRSLADTARLLCGPTELRHSAHTSQPLLPLPSRAVLPSRSRAGWSQALAAVRREGASGRGVARAWPGRAGASPGSAGGSMSLGTAFRRADAKASRRSDSAQLLHPSHSSHVRGRDHRPQQRWHLTVSEPADGPAVPFLVGPLRISWNLVPVVATDHSLSSKVQM